MPTPNMNLILPVDHDTDALWGAVLNQAFGLIDAHRHLPGEGKQVPSDGIGIDKNLPYNGFQIRSLGAAAFSPAPLPGINTSLFVSDGTSGLSANELYWRSAAGASVKLTSGGTINISVVGGIVDDYASVGARLGYDDGLKRYTFKEGTADAFAFAHVHCGSVRLSPFNSITGNFVEHACPAAIATQYTVTWPLTLPGNTVLQQVDATGQTIFSNALAANQSITVSGTGDYKHGTQTINLALQSDVGAHTGSGPLTLSGAGQGLILGITLRTGARILAARAKIIDSITGPSKLQLKVESVTNGLLTTIATSSPSAGDGSSQSITVTGLTTTVVTATSYYVFINFQTGSASSTISSVEVDYDQP